MGREPTLTTFSVKHEVVTLEELFEEIRSGYLRIPRFHREFEWERKNMRLLFASVRRGFPIGSLAIWEPGVRYESRSHFGSIEQREPALANYAYVIDGRHRLETLFGATHVTGPLPNDAALGRWWMWYDLHAEKISHLSRGPTHLPLRYLLGTTEFLQFCSNVLKTRPDDGPYLVEKAERLLRQVRAYKVPVARIRGGKLDDVKNIFARLNSLGVPMDVE